MRTATVGFTIMRLVLLSFALLLLAVYAAVIHIMAPKAPQKAIKPKGKTIKDGGAVKSATSKVTASSLNEDWPGQVDRWAGKPQAFCQSCSQKTSTVDKHSKPGQPRFLHWVQARRTAASTKHHADAQAAAKKAKKGSPEANVSQDDRFPSGHECYPCFNVRRNYFFPDSQDLLIEKRNNDTNIDDQANAHRQGMVSGETAAAKSKVPKVRTVETGDRQFDKNFVTGTFQALWRFAKMRNLRFQSQDELIDIIKEKYSEYRIIVNKQGEVGVEILDQQEGEYRFERGHDDYTEYHKLESYGNESAAHSEAYNSKLLKRDLKDADRTIFAGAAAVDRLEDSVGSPNRPCAETQAYPDTSPASSPREHRSASRVGDQDRLPQTVVTIEESQTPTLRPPEEEPPIRRLGAVSNLSGFSSPQGQEGLKSQLWRLHVIGSEVPKRGLQTLLRGGLQTLPFELYRGCRKLDEIVSELTKKALRKIRRFTGKIKTCAHDCLRAVCSWLRFCSCAMKQPKLTLLVCFF